MAKKILIIETSLRVNSNSDRLAERFAEGDNRIIGLSQMTFREKAA